MRIVSGRWKGRRLNPPSRIQARPTTDFARESIFNILNNWVEFSEVDVLDLFAGTGGMTFEFLSRGAKTVTAVDQAHLTYTFMSRTARELEIDNLKLYKSDVFQFLKTHRKKYDLIFADPPYKLENIEEIHRKVWENEMLEEEGMLIIEHGKDTNLTKLEGFTEKRVYGNANFSFFSKPEFDYSK